MTYGSPSPFPPSFEGNPLAYAFGLFGDIVVAALASAILLSFVFERRRTEAVLRMLHLPPGNIPPEAYSALNLYRAKHISIWSFVVLRALPDALWMTLWGEVPESAIRVLLAIDLIADGLAILPFGIAVILWAWGKQVVEQALVEKNAYVNGRAPWAVIRQNLAIIGLVVLIAAGVTIGKAGA